MGIVSVLVIASAYIIPIVILIVVIHGMYKKVDIYDEFVIGAEDGMKTVASIVPTLIGLMMAVGILRASGFLDMLANMLGDYTDKIGLPAVPPGSPSSHALSKNGFSIRPAQQTCVAL